MNAEEILEYIKEMMGKFIEIDRVQMEKSINFEFKHGYCKGSSDVTTQLLKMIKDCEERR
jgi:transposase